MGAHIFRSNPIIGLVIGLLLMSSTAMARGPHRYYFREGRFYHPSRFWFDAAVNPLPIGAVVEALPFGYTVVSVGGMHYCLFNDIYFQTCPTGYVVVADPTITNVKNTESPAVPPTKIEPSVSAPQSPPSNDSTVTINVPKKNGEFAPVKLVKRDNGYIGPQGEFYDGHPTVNQLKTLYGD